MTRFTLTRGAEFGHSYRSYDLLFGDPYSRMVVARIIRFDDPPPWAKGCRWVTDMTYSGARYQAFVTRQEARRAAESQFLIDVSRALGEAPR